MKILMVGNTNNYPHMLGRALSRQGHHVIHIIDQTYDLHRPSNRYGNEVLDALELLDIAPLRLRTGAVPERRRRMVQAIADKSDLLIANGTAPRILNLRHDATFMLYTGTDLTDLAGMARPPTTDFFAGLRDSPRNLMENAVSRRGRRQLRSCVGFSFFPKDSVPLGETALGTVASKAPRLQILMSDSFELARSYRRNTCGSAFRIFNVARISWHSDHHDSRTQLDLKGTDILLNGFKLFLDTTGARATLVLVRKGRDVKRAEALTHRLGIAPNIEWREEMTQRQVFEQYSMADVVTENLGPSLLGMGGLDALGFGTPLIARSYLHSYTEWPVDESPVLEAFDEHDVARQLSALYSDSGYRQSIVESGLEFSANRLAPTVSANRVLSLLQ